MTDEIDLNEEKKSIHINSINSVIKSSKSQNLSYDSSKNRENLIRTIVSNGTVQTISILNSFIKSLLEILPEEFKEYALKNDFSDEVLRNKIIDDIKNMVKNLKNKIEELNKSLDLNKQIKEIIINQKKYNEILVKQNNDLMSKLSNSLDEIEKLKNEINSLNISFNSNFNSPRKNNKVNNNININTIKRKDVTPPKEPKNTQTIFNPNNKRHKKILPPIKKNKFSNNNNQANRPKKEDGN